MQIVIDRAPVFFGVQVGDNRRILRFSQAEMATLRKADAIIEEARTRLADLMGEDEWQYDPLYTLSVQEVVSDYPNREIILN